MRTLWTMSVWMVPCISIHTSIVQSVLIIIIIIPLYYVHKTYTHAVINCNVHIQNQWGNLWLIFTLCGIIIIITYINQSQGHNYLLFNKCWHQRFTFKLPAQHDRKQAHAVYPSELSIFKTGCWLWLID